MNALRLFLASGGFLLVAILWQMVRSGKISETEATIIGGIKGASLAGMVFAAFLKVKEAVFWQVFIGMLISFSLFAYFLPSDYREFERHAPTFGWFFVPVAFASMADFYSRGRMGKFFSVIILTILIVAFMERYGGDAHVQRLERWFAPSTQTAVARPNSSQVGPVSGTGTVAKSAANEDFPEEARANKLPIAIPEDITPRAIAAIIEGRLPGLKIQTPTQDSVVAVFPGHYLLRIWITDRLWRYMTDSGETISVGGFNTLDEFLRKKVSWTRCMEQNGGNAAACNDG